MKQFLLMSLLVVAMSFGFTTSAQEPAQEPALIEVVQEHGLVGIEHSQVLTQSEVLTTIEVPSVDPAQAIVDLVTNWKEMSPLAIGASIILLLIQLLKSSLFGGFFKHLEWKRFFITFLGVLYGVVYMVSTGSPWINAIVVGVISTGGAVAIYEALKPILEKKK